jgi:pyridoxine/pyridoxamine 5'-phosphate oxidase
MDLGEVFDFVARHRLAVLSTVYANGTPEAALVGIAVHQGREIIFDTSVTSRKFANLRARPAIALVVGWDGETTIQIEGVAREPGEQELERAKQSYFLAWPDGRAREHWPTIAYFLITPTWVRYSDYLAGPLVVEFDVAADTT